MKLKHRFAVVSWCPDLTDPNAVSIPVAVLLIAKAGRMNFAASMGMQVEGDLDAFEQDLLRDVPLLIRRYVDDFIKSNPAAKGNDVLLAVHHALRNSLHVSKVEEEQVTNVDVVTADTLMGLLQALFEREVKNPVEQICGREPKHEHSEPDGFPLTPMADEMPAWQAWNLEQMRADVDRVSYPA